MNSSEREQDDSVHPGWEHISNAAEDFARRVARDASRFAARMEEHAGEFARDLSRDWRRAQRDYWRECRRARHASAPEVRRIFEEVRGVLADVLEGVDELIGRIFPQSPAADAATDDGEWVRVLTNRAGACHLCGRALTAGEEAFVRRAASGMEFQCLACAESPPA